jgi:hypothetical protein
VRELDGRRGAEAVFEFQRVHAFADAKQPHEGMPAVIPSGGRAQSRRGLLECLAEVASGREGIDHCLHRCRRGDGCLCACRLRIGFQHARVELHGLPRRDGEQRTVGHQQFHEHVAARAHGLALLESVAHMQHARVPAGVHGGDAACSLDGDDAGERVHRSLIALAFARSTGFIR